MANVRDTMDAVTGWLHTATDFGLRVIVALVVVDVLFPASSAITENIGVVAGQFGEQRACRVNCLVAVPAAVQEQEGVT